MNLQICTTAGEDLLLRDVSTFLVDNDTIRVLYCNGTQQNYPLQNVRWYGPEDPVVAPLRTVKDLLALTDIPFVESGYDHDYDDPYPDGNPL